MEVNPMWWAVGLIGQGLFFSRFLVQWIASERVGRSVVPRVFWFLSLAGGAVLTIYALHRREPVFLLGQVVGLFVYSRNLVLLYGRPATAGAAPIQVGYVHVQDIQVEEGDTVRAGELVARIGNNGISDAPHVHVGALRGDLVKLMSGEVPDSEVVPLQVRFDLAVMGRLRGYVR